MSEIMKYSIKKKIYRKGFLSHVQFAILAMVALIIFSLFLYKAYTNISEKMSVQSCQNSIAAHSLVAKGSFSEIFTDIKCPTREITIKKLSKTNEIIAEDMHRCWYIWGRGKGQYFQGDGNYCYICSVYQFGDKGQEVKGLTNYLANNDVKIKYAGEVPGIRYIDYFQGYSTPNADYDIKSTIQVPVEIDVINTSERYATIFVYASGKDAIDKMLEGGKRTTAVTGMALFGTVGGAGAIGAAGLAAKATTTAYFWTFTTAYGTYAAPLSVTAVEAATAIGAGTSITTVTTAGTVLGLTPVGWAIAGVAVVGVAGYGIYLLLDNPDPKWASYVAFRPYNADELKALSCDQVVVNQMSNVGR
jgi:hypothetical protein